MLISKRNRFKKKSSPLFHGHTQFSNATAVPKSGTSNSNVTLVQEDVGAKVWTLTSYHTLHSVPK